MSAARAAAPGRSTGSGITAPGRSTASEITAPGLLAASETAAPGRSAASGTSARSRSAASDIAPPSLPGAPGVSAWPRQERLDPACVVAGCVVFAIVVFVTPLLNDGDTLWQIRTGAWILAHHAIPSIDPFSYTAGDRHWFPHEWLSEVLLVLAFRAGGLPGVMALAAAATGLTAAVLLHHLRRFLPFIYALAAAFVGLANAAPSLLARPHLLAWPCLALWCGGLVAARAARRPPSFWLLPVMLLWVNLHGSFMVGLVLPFAFIVEAVFDPGADRPRAALGWAGFILAAWAVALLNPDFLAGVLFPIHMLGMRSLVWIGEWQPTDFSRTQPLELILLGALALGLSGAVRLPPIRLVLFLGLIHAALTHSRDEQLVGLVGVLVLAEPLGRCLKAQPEDPPIAVPRRLAAGAMVLALVALAVRMVLPLSPARSDVAFAAMLDRVPPALRAEPVLNDYSYGGLLIFYGVRPFIDSRADLYGDAFLSRYRRLLVAADPAEVERTLTQYRIAWTIFPASAPIVQLLDHESGWRRLVAANGIVIQAREDKALP